MQIGQLATRHQISVDTIRFYERQGLLPKARRSTGNYRLYTDEHFERLNFILNCRFLDMSLDDIRALLRLRNGRANKCADIKAFVDDHVDQIEHRIVELRQLAKQLKALRVGCTPESPIEGCTILVGLDKSDKIRKSANGNQKGKGSLNGRCC
jgi:Cd(II)/Pb(II)-responsive transcriptional regulator